MSWRKILSLYQKWIRAWTVKLFSAHSRGYSFDLLQNNTTKLCLPHVICAVTAALSRALCAFTSGRQEFNKTSILHFKNINLVYYDITLIPTGFRLKKFYLLLLLSSPQKKDYSSHPQWDQKKCSTYEIQSWMDSTGHKHLLLEENAYNAADIAMGTLVY